MWLWPKNKWVEWISNLFSPKNKFSGEKKEEHMYNMLVMICYQECSLKEKLHNRWQEKQRGQLTKGEKNEASATS